MPIWLAPARRRAAPRPLANSRPARSMSPEQVRGKPVDKRTDIWAFGCVLFEILTGTRAFVGETASDTIAAVLEREPAWSRLPAATSPGVRRLLHRCLEKDAGQRLRYCGRTDRDRRCTVGSGRGTRERAPRMTALAELLTQLLRGGRCSRMVAPAADRPRSVCVPHNSIYVVTPERHGARFAHRISRRVLVAFTARPDAGGLNAVCTRSLSQLAAQPLAGTEGAKQPFWSPDSESLGYFAGSKLLKIALAGGAAVEICDVPMHAVVPGVPTARSSSAAASNGVRTPAGLAERWRRRAGHAAGCSARRELPPLASVPARWHSLSVRPCGRRGAPRGLRWAHRSPSIRPGTPLLRSDSSTLRAFRR